MMSVNYNDLDDLIVNDKNTKVKGSLKEFCDLYRKENVSQKIMQEIYLVIFKFLDAELRLRDSEPEKYDAISSYREKSYEIFESRVGKDSLGFGLVYASVFRKLKIPTVLVESVKYDWINNFKETLVDDKDLFKEHVFLEVFIENQWKLLDSTTGFIYGGYDKENPCLPNGYFAVNKSKSGINFEVEREHRRNILSRFVVRDIDYNDPNYEIEEDFLSRERIKNAKYNPNLYVKALDYEDKIEKVPVYKLTK